MNILFLIGGLILILLGANGLTDGAASVAKRLRIPSIVIGLTIVAFGTSAPELTVSVSSALKGSADIAIGNVVGSNIFNILFVIGITALICNVPFESKFLIDSAVAVAAGVILWLGTIRHKELRRPCGGVMLVAYVGYFVYLCMN